MMTVHQLTNNGLGEITYVLADETGKCAIVDPGFTSPDECEALVSLISRQNLEPISLLFTHLHFDHVYGARFVIDKYGLKASAHELELPVLEMNKLLTSEWRIPSPEAFKVDNLINDADVITIGNSSLTAFLVPGHTPGSLAYYCAESKFCISGDALFMFSIGRCDFPGGSEKQLIAAIKQKLMTLPDDTIVYPGHGSKTSIGNERKFNPYLQ